MPEGILPQLASIVVVGVVAQWVAWRVKLPSILLLLICGLAVGPLLGWLKPDLLFGDLLQPIVSLSVAIILYEGGLTLKLSDLPKVGSTVWRLTTLSATVTWLLSAVAAHYLLGLSVGISALLGAVLVVTGPTVIAPLLRHIRPTGPVASILRWEGIVIDPIGALLTVLIYEAILIGEAKEVTAYIAIALLKTVVIGGGLGIAAAALLILLVRRYWIADHLQNAMSLMLVFLSFAVANAAQHEAGLWAVTIMGLVLANQKYIDVEHILEFKENLQVLLISALFVVLAARIDLASLTTILIPGLGFVAVLVLVVRPLAVWFGTVGSTLRTGERVFLAWMAPRGIVAAAVASMMALQLEEAGIEGASKIVPITFITIIATVAIYGLTGPILARRLGLSETNPQGILFVGANTWTRSLAQTLQELGFRVALIDNNWSYVSAARMAGLPTYAGSALAEHTVDKLDLGGIGRVLAVTSNDWVNVLVVHRFERLFGRANCYQLAPSQGQKSGEKHRYLQGRWLFGEDMPFSVLDTARASQVEFKATKLSEEFDLEAFRARYGQDAPILFVIRDKQILDIATADKPLQPEAGDTVISLVVEPKTS